MTDNNHPMLPTQEQLTEWDSERFDEGENFDVMMIKAFQAGADQELEACIKLLADLGGDGEMIRRYRRPKPPSLKEQSIALIDKIQGNKEMWQTDDLDIVRRALESLPD